MAFNVWGPISCKEPDTTSLYESDINGKLAALQEGNEAQFIQYGDSIYPSMSHTQSRHQPIGNVPLGAADVAENRGMSSCREAIEWDYGDVGRYWKLVDYKRILKIRLMPVSDIYLSALLLRNAHVTMNGCNASLYFDCEPPTFEEWISQGPR
jgi:hypothetical protein